MGEVRKWTWKNPKIKFFEISKKCNLYFADKKFSTKCVKLSKVANSALFKKKSVKAIQFEKNNFNQRNLQLKQRNFSKLEKGKRQFDNSAIWERLTRPDRGQVHVFRELYPTIHRHCLRYRQPELMLSLRGYADPVDNKRHISRHRLVNVNDWKPPSREDSYG